MYKHFKSKEQLVQSTEVSAQGMVRTQELQCDWTIGNKQNDCRLEKADAQL